MQDAESVDGYACINSPLLGVQVDFEGPYPIEGAKEVGTLMTRYVSRALRAWSSQQAARKQLAVTGGKKPSREHGGFNSKVVSALQKVKAKAKGGQDAPAEEDILPVVHLNVGRDALGNPQLVAQTQLQFQQCVGS